MSNRIRKIKKEKVSRFKSVSSGEVVEVLQVRKLSGRAFEKIKGEDGLVHWEEVSLKTASKEEEKLKNYRVIKKGPQRGISSDSRTVIRVGASGIIGFGSNLAYKGINSDGIPEYWHIPSATILVEDVNYAARQIASTLSALKSRRGLI